MGLVDTHCHLDVSRFDLDRRDVLNRAFAAGLSGVVVPGLGPENWETLLGYPREDPRIQVGLGIHPQLLPDTTEADDEAALELLEQKLSQGGAIAVGECGLDGPSSERAPFERQVRVLKRHFALARKFELPILMHCFRAHPQLIELMKEERFPERGVLMHSYSGGLDLAKFYEAQGCHFALAGPITYAGARKPLASVKAISPERLMLETDAPDQCPHPHRGQRNEPSYLPLIATAMAAALGLDGAGIERLTTGNAERFFRHRFAPSP